MNPVLLVLSVLLCIAGAFLLYLASPQQQLRARGPWPARHGVWLGAALSLVALGMVWQVLPPVEAVSAWLVLLTLVLSVAPFLGAWRSRARARKAA